MDAFRGGAEPLVGEIVGLRTFRVDDSGLLLPLYSTGAWYDGPNTAICTPPTGERHAVHAVPSEHCECGFYAYGTVEAAQRNRQTRYVRAVVSCWGGVVAGTQGVRAQHARIDALWLHPEVPRWLRSRVAQRYPSARQFADADAMLAEFPLSDLPCYQPPPIVRPQPRVAGVVAGAALLALGLLPMHVLRASPALFALWLLATVAAAGVTAWLALGTRGVGHLAAAFVMGGVVAWLLAPVFGMFGWMLRVPLLRGAVVGAGGYLIALRPHYFPIVRTPKERAFCGVRP